MKIEVRNGVVIVNNFEIVGFVDEENNCMICEMNLIYYEDYDAYICPKCNRWTETKCSDSNCNYCINRPEKPLPNTE
ncbi:hypothetical protein H9636_09855 [Ureibacillus sp. Re31]|uniref:Phage protein n=1 Tax=Ureibacillus galli TaxID=2762222 RepID=A0ABR8XCJ7_9BACL|nr:hypothetical protein [Ureibacillus galli]MBD8026958.1 hypothetical protein [Ureibacillus galli]